MDAMKSMLDRNLARQFVQQDWADFDQLLEKTVNYMTNVLGRCAAGQRNDVERVVIVGLYRGIIQYLDGLQITLRENAVRPGIVCLRGAFEASVFIDYLLQADTLERAKAYMVFFYSEQKKDLQRLIELHSEQQNIGEQVGPVEDIKRAEFSFDKEQAERTIEQVDTQLASDLFVATCQRLAEKEQAGKKVRHWYSLIGEAQNLRMLVQEVGREKEYIVLYKYWSLVVHSLDAPTFLDTIDEVSLMRPIRPLDAVEARTTYGMALVYGLLATDQVLGHLRPEEVNDGFAKWCETEIHPIWRKYTT